MGGSGGGHSEFIWFIYQKMYGAYPIHLTDIEPILSLKLQ